jgi:serine/threonine protein phosphatase PrpC
VVSGNPVLDTREVTVATDTTTLETTFLDGPVQRSYAAPLVRPTAGWATARGLRMVLADAAAVHVTEDGLTLAVADGIGDSTGAAYAARLAAETASTTAGWAGTTGAIAAAGRVVRVARSTGETTGDAVLVVAAADREGWSVSWVGDCRAYLVRPSGPAQRLTSDHTIGEFLRVSRARAARHWDHVVTTTASNVKRRDVGSVRGGPLDGRLVLCTDGVHRVLDDHAIAHAVRGIADPVVAARRVVDMALMKGTRDNAGVAVADLPTPR